MTYNLTDLMYAYEGTASVFHRSLSSETCAERLSYNYGRYLNLHSDPGCTLHLPEIKKQTLELSSSLL